MIQVCTRPMQGYSVLHYRYDTGMGKFEFHLGCEVGEPWRPQAQAMAKEIATEMGGTIKQIELPATPWLVDVVIKEKS